MMVNYNVFMTMSTVTVENLSLGSVMRFYFLFRTFKD